LAREFWKAILVGLLSLLYALHELHVVSLPFPQRRRQVPARWRYRFHPYVTAFLFGVLLGLGYVTFISVATLYIVTVAVIIEGSPLYGVIVFGLFGLGRAALLWPLALHTQTFEQLERTVCSLFLTKTIVHLINGFALAFSGAYLLMAWLSRGP